MAKKSVLDSKLGSWADQANLTQIDESPVQTETAKKETRKKASVTKQTVKKKPIKDTQKKPPRKKQAAKKQTIQQPIRDSQEKKGSKDKPMEKQHYQTTRSLIERINDASVQNNRPPNEIVGQLLTWALDQAEAGKYRFD